ncbi:ABC transporter substrate-binding protein [Microvirga aerilata]|uniref:ABC transporter substrate-binding protein n=1 Tax=Microvirga aerilata TaxID=670292 RepID=A0A936ZPD4_9HYPH|nr:ABC transporter substrate-binding protein [Microvirga aerilata]MBL0408248.1 ABC transporter substrate-binding protein [Microvirga aerilata]
MSHLTRRVWAIIVGVSLALVLAVGSATLLWIGQSPICLAVATSITGPSSSAGLESFSAAKLYIDEVNRTGGVHGHPVELTVFDDASTADQARANVEPIAQSACIAVLGHYLSTASLAAGPGYKAARIPALTGTSFVDELTKDNPYYFRAQTTSSVQGRSIAEYLRHVLQTPAVHIVHSRDSFGRSFLDGFATGYEGQAYDIWSFDPDPGTRSASAQAVADALVRQPDQGVIVIGTGADNIPAVLTAIRRRGLTGPVVAAGGAGSEEFLQNFAHEPEETEQPGFFSHNLYASAPVIFDSAGAPAQAFAISYLNATGRHPGWIAAGANGAARLMIEAMRRARIQARSDSRDTDRERIRAELAKINRPETAVSGLNGLLYFDSHRDMPRPVRVGFFRLGRFVTAPQQLVLVEHPEAMDLKRHVQDEHVVSVGPRHYWRQRVVYSGIDIIRLNRIDVRQGTFNIDFFLWMRYAGEDEAPTRVEFPALLDRAAFDPTRPLESGKEDGLTYRLYRIAGDFKAGYDLRDYPFDVQQLDLRFRNTAEGRERIAYVVDTFGLRLAGDNGSSVSDASPYSGLQLWRYLQTRYFVTSLPSMSTLGKASAFGSVVRTEYAGFSASVVLQRDFAIFMLKTLLPLFLLAIVVFTTLFFPETLFRERTTIPVTAMLTSAVLLVSVNNQLGDVGYTVAIEILFYAFFGLCLMAMLTAFGHERLRSFGKVRLAHVLDRSTQVLYAGTALAIFGLFYWRYGMQ